MDVLETWNVVLYPGFVAEQVDLHSSVPRV
jgi:hypothetical protein